MTCGADNVPRRCAKSAGRSGHPTAKGRKTMPFVNIRIVREAIASDPEGKKATIADKVTSVISEAAGAPRSDVWVVFEEVAARDWYLGAQNVESLRKANQSTAG